MYFIKDKILSFYFLFVFETLLMSLYGYKPLLRAKIAHEIKL